MRFNVRELIMAQLVYGAFPKVLWAELYALNPANYVHKFFFVTDIGGGSLWFSDGTKWKPVNGSVILANADISAITTTQTSSNAIAGWQLDLPAGLMDGVGTKLSGLLRGVRTTPQTGTASIGLAFANNNASFGLCDAHVASGSTALQAFGIANRKDSSTVRCTGFWGFSWSGNATSTFADYANNEITDPLSIYLMGNVAAAGETLGFKDVIVELFK